MAKEKAEKKLAGGKVPVIALKAFGSHVYGAEFQMAKGAALDKLIADGSVRIDDRMTQPAPAEPSEPAE